VKSTKLVYKKFLIVWQNLSPKCQLRWIMAIGQTRLAATHTFSFSFRSHALKLWPQSFSSHYLLIVAYFDHSTFRSQCANAIHQRIKSFFCFSYTEMTPISITGLRPYLSAAIPHNTAVIARPTMKAAPAKPTKKNIKHL